MKANIMKANLFIVTLLGVAGMGILLKPAMASEKPSQFFLSQTDKEEDGTMLYPCVYNTVLGHFEQIKKWDPKILTRLIAAKTGISDDVRDETREMILGHFLHGCIRLKEYSKVLTKEQLNQEGLWIHFPDINPESVQALVALTDLWLKGHPISKERLEELRSFGVQSYADFNKRRTTESPQK